MMLIVVLSCTNEDAKDGLLVTVYDSLVVATEVATEAWTDNS